MTTQTRLFGAALAATLMAACANHTPVIDHRTSNKSNAEYKRDLSECQAYADDRGFAKDTAIGTLGGAALGAALGAAVGGIGGGAGMGTNAAMEQKRIINNCMRNRGYDVLE